MTTSAPSNPPSSAYSAMLEERQVELVRHQRASDVGRERRVALDRRKVARAGPFVGDVPFGPHTERERRVVIEEERRDVIVVDQQQHVRALVREPRAERCEILEDRRPYGVV